ncbi:hypothetical protein MMU07_03880 [Aquiflexum sp. LQ15W]|uniref:hypothetical protein n=1 Tax=Cognataquiflexum nitidum TaxID=2922272 RepID=UPI001F1418CA|nr:hypothetical protein [Cognataquiflexum nitidum]MCH6198707.1 hypothetical protein [Cognataquiflexum nitidum]
MVSIEHILHLPLTEPEILESIQKAIENTSISELDNLRFRHPNIQFDCMIRGYLGEFAIRKWLKENGIEVERTNLILEDDQVDIDFVYKGQNIELKTSLVPDADLTIQNAVLNRDIKLIKREEKIENLRGDIHLQVFFNQRRKAKDDWLKALKLDLGNKDPKYLYDAFSAKRYRTDMYFVGWIDKITLVTRIYLMGERERTWTFQKSKREFWSCRILESNKPVELIYFLKSI